MTVLRKDPDGISNWLNGIVKDLGKRGSTFIDIDACFHDKDSNRFLFIELKHEGEYDRKERVYLGYGQRVALAGLAKLSKKITVWLVVKRRDDDDGVCLGVVVAEAPDFDTRQGYYATIEELATAIHEWWNEPS